MKYTGIPKKTPLYESHLALKAKMVDFSGWSLPVQYAGILKEHLHTRQKCSIFDICHMGEFLIEGKDAQSELSEILTCDVSSIGVNRCKYCFILNEDGCFIDDAVLFKFTGSRFMLVVNAGRIDIDFIWISDRLSSGTTITDSSPATAKIDLQGPSAPAVAAALFSDSRLASARRFSFLTLPFEGIEITCSATGYTGEEGFEFFLPAEYAAQLWNSLLDFPEVLPAGLGARDSLRLEKGFSLYGHDISESVNPYQAGLERFINPELDFIGSESLRRIRENGISKKLVPFLCEGRRSARDGYGVYKESKKIGHVTSGVYSPVLKRGIGLCLISREHSFEGTPLSIKNEDVAINAVITKLPFV